MASKKVEDIHSTLLAKLLSDSGLVCLRSPQLSKETEEEELEIEEEVAAPTQYEEETVVEETVVVVSEHTQEEQLAEQLPSVFPSPSIRRIIPERLRRIEAHNRIKVLPDTLKSGIDPAAIPKINSTAPQKYIDILAELTGCHMYKISQAEYWFLDTLANLLRRAQEALLERPIQAILILWFCEWMKEMQHFDAASRERMLRRWKDNMLQTAKFIVEEGFIPTPELAGVYYKVKDAKDGDESKSVSAAASLSAAMNAPIGGTLYECSMRDLTKIIHYIYDLFGTDYQYDLVRSIFTFGPEYNLIHGPYPLEVPKSLYALLKAKPTKKEPKSPAAAAKKEKGKPVTKEVLTEEYLALMAAIAKEREEYAEMELREQEEWNKRSHILPLQMAADDAFFDFYWPPPTPEPEPEVVTEPVKKPKKK